jgi:Mn2+/Fe2+ NRAMP family transporter
MPPTQDRLTQPQRVRLGRVLWHRLKQHPLTHVGPGLITGVADDDPSGIATYSQAGAQYGLGMLWTMPLAFPLMSAMQSMCAQIGRVTGRGLAANIKAAFPPAILKGVVLLLLIANTLNIAADIAAMGEVSELVTGLSRHVATLVFVTATLLLQVFIPYHRYVIFLKWLTLSLLAYAGVVFLVHVPWAQVALRTFWPRLRLDSNAATWWWACSAPPSAPACFSGRRRKRWKTCSAGPMPCPCWATRTPRPLNCGASDGTPGAACCTPT